MTLRDLIDAFRDEAFDSGPTKFWGDALLTRLANEAQNEACRRGNQIIDSSGLMCSVAVTAGEPVVQIDQAVLEIRRARLSLDSVPLSPVTVEYMDSAIYGWESDTGAPSAYLTDYQSGAIRLYPSPTANDTILLTVRRLPTSDMEDDGDEPEIRMEARPALVQWMLYRAYSKQDADAFDPAKAARSLAEFEREFGKKSSARNESWQRGRPEIGGCPIA